jgi:hypothetical protein
MRRPPARPLKMTPQLTPGFCRYHELGASKPVARPSAPHSTRGRLRLNPQRFRLLKTSAHVRQQLRTCPSTAAHSTHSKVLKMSAERRLNGQTEPTGAMAIRLEVSDTPGRIRTCDHRIRSPALCPLSYGGWV